MRNNTRKWMTGLTAVMLSGMLALTGCGGNEKPTGQGQATNNQEQGKELKKVQLMLDWTPNTNHTGIYAARDKGYFAEQGLEVDIMIPGDDGANPAVAAGTVPFGVGYQESVTLARVGGLPIVSVAAVIQHNTSGFASPKEKGIDSPKKFEGMRYGGWGEPVEQAVIESVMRVEGADVNKVDIMSIGNGDFFSAVKRDIDFAWIYYAWTGVEAELRGEELNMVYLTDYSPKLDYYTPIIITNEQMIAEDPDTVRAFVAAVAKGYEFAIAQPEEAAGILAKAEPDLKEELVVASQKWLSPRYQDDAPRWGEQKLSVWENYSEWMFENGLLESKLEVEKAFTNEFLPEK